MGLGCLCELGWVSLWVGLGVFIGLCYGIGRKNGSDVVTTMADLSTSPTTKTITIDKVASVISEIVNIEFDKNIVKYIKAQLGQYDLELLNQIRDVILHKKGNQTLILNGTNLDRIS